MRPSKRQEEYLDFIDRWNLEQRRPPTYREIAAELEVTLAAVQSMVERLRVKGYLTGVTGEKKPRTLFTKGDNND